jgi:hypothetical protein
MRMRQENLIRLSRAGLLLMALSGCSALLQNHTSVLIREPGHYFYDPPVPTEQAARQYWEYATIAGLAYPNDPLAEQSACATVNIPGGRNANTATMTDADARKIGSDNFSAIYQKLTDLGWSQWPEFQHDDISVYMHKLDLYASVWQRQSRGRTTIVVAFKGTNFWSAPDWNANLRWITRFIPHNFDQYDEVVKYFGPAFKAAYRRHSASWPDHGSAIIYAAGHSLGGGLAQQFAYALPLDGPETPLAEQVPRVSRIYAFDPSPVTGYYSVDVTTRTVNERGTNEPEGLWIDRVLEKGEILSYLRAALTLVYFPSAADPAIEGVRFDLFPSLNPIESHSIDELACKLFEAATSTGRPAVHYDPESDGTSAK